MSRKRKLTYIDELKSNKKRKVEEIRFYRFMNDDMTHNGFVYQENKLNVLTEPFNDDIKQDCCAGGLYFTNKENLHKFESYGRYFYEIEFTYT